MNINDIVKVQLTDLGRKVIAQKKLTIPKEDEQGWSEWQLWYLMQMFEGHIGLGKTLPFEAEIIIGR